MGALLSIFGWDMNLRWNCVDAGSIPNHVRNIIIFGQTGVGKSSLINMVAGKYDLASTSDFATGCTSECTSYKLVLGDQEYLLWDTPGLNEGNQGTVPDQKAKESISELLKTLSKTPSGVTLLVYCVTGSGSTIEQTNFDIVWGIMAQTMLPILVVLTKCEHSNDNGDEWWQKYYSSILALNGVDMDHPQHVRVVTTKGKDGRYAKDYDESKERVSAAIKEYGHAPGWKLPTWSAQYWSKIDRSIRVYEQRYRTSGTLEARTIVVNNYQKAASKRARKIHDPDLEGGDPTVT